jgi:shikimate dehydrogenase
MAQFGLLGKTLTHSFSAGYFKAKFEALGLPHTYQLFERTSAQEMQKTMEASSDLVGFNITLPYKKDILALATELDESVAQIGAANVLVRLSKGGWKAYNTDVLGFSASLLEWLTQLQRPLPTSAWVLGNGGASQAVQVALNRLAVPFRVLARQHGQDLNNQPFLLYPEAANLPPAQLWVQTTPTGQYPGPAETLPLPFENLSLDNLAFDLVYNPTETAFMQRASAQGAPTLNGLPMLHAQAEAAWDIWCQHWPALLDK